jgi:hypothetical protein
MGDWRGERELRRGRWGERRKKGGLRMTGGAHHFLLIYV